MHTVTLQIWDTAGQERYQALGSPFYRGADACILVYDITSGPSFDHLNMWREGFIEKGAPKDPSTFPFFVFGNKKDKETERKIGTQLGQNWSKQNNAPFEETSALDS